MPTIYELAPSPPALCVVDVGAMWLGEKEVTYRNLLKHPSTTVVGFEPVESECQKLRAMNRPGHVFLPYVVGDGTERTFHITNYSMTSSIYEPNTPLLRHFMGIEELTRVVSSTTFNTRRLDEIPEITRCDYLKMDVQGAELDVLRGATRLLKDIAVLQCEVEFIPLYKQQPLFGDIDLFLRSQGFWLHRIAPFSGRVMRPFIGVGKDGKPDPVLRGNQALWTEVIYIPRLDTLREQPPERLLRAAIILHEVYGAPDVAAHFLLYYDKAMGSDLWSPHVQSVIGKLPPRPAVD